MHPRKVELYWVQMTARRLKIFGTQILEIDGNFRGSDGLPWTAGKGCRLTGELTEMLQMNNKKTFRSYFDGRNVLRRV